jgi:hypothetical protein
MTNARVFHVEALHRVAGGGDIDNAELDAAVPNSLTLDREERSAWEELSHWADDDDIRAKDPRYTAWKRERMQDRLSELDTKDS